MPKQPDTPVSPPRYATPQAVGLDASSTAANVTGGGPSKPTDSRIVEEFDCIVLRDFLAENWSLWAAYCQALDTNADDLYVRIGGSHD